MRFFLLITLLSLNSWASNDLFKKTHHKVPLEGTGPFHFTSKKHVKVFTKTLHPFFTISKPGLYEYFEKNKRKRIFALNSSQMKFYQVTKPVTQKVSSLNWTYEFGTLLLSGSNLPESIKSFLIGACDKYGGGQVSLDFKPKFTAHTIPQSCRKRITPKSARKIHVLIRNASAADNSSYGLGIPSSIAWKLENGKRLLLEEQSGQLNANKGGLKSKMLNSFSSQISVERPVVFETGAEVGIQPRGVFNRNNVQWKKATSKFEIKLITASKNEAEIQLNFNRRSRTAQNTLFELESFEKTAFLNNGSWQKVLSFSENSKSRLRNGLFGMGLTGSRSRSKSLSTKEVWVKVTNAD